MIAKWNSGRAGTIGVRGRPSLGVAALVAAAAVAFAVVTPAGAIEPQACQSCQPPLAYAGGRVLTMSTGGGLTVTPIYWVPNGYTFPANYESIINGYIANVAAASGSTSNVFSVDTEYYQDLGGTKTQISYRVQAGTPIVDTDAYPPNGCTPASGYSACITDDQLRAELKHVTSSHGLNTDLAHFYPVFYPPGVETKDRDGTTSAGDFCAYHRAFGSGFDQTVYSDEPYTASSGCNKGQAPNGSAAADGAIDTLSHEWNEAITDPDDTAWFDNKGNETGDMCGVYGAPLGSTNPSDPSHSEYNQVINGGKYYTQAEFSNVAFSKLGYDKGCALSQAQVQSLTGGASSSGSSGSGSNSGTSASSHSKAPSSRQVVITVVNDATPTMLPANGTSTAKVSLGVENPAGLSVANDPIHFGVAVRSGTGQCGTLSTSDKSTNTAGNADITYTASKSDVSCWVLATEGDHGQAAQAVIYQGTSQKQSPTFVASYPTTVQAGGSRTFTIKATNPTSTPMLSTRPHFVIFPGDGATKNVNANQVHLSYSTTGANGTFTPVSLYGSTIKEGAIQGYVGPLQGTTLPAHSTTTYTFDLALADSVPVSGRKPLMALETYLDQIDPADGTGATLGDTYAYQVGVPSETTTNHPSVGLLILGTVVALTIGAGLIFWRREKNPPHQPPPPATP